MIKGKVKADLTKSAILSKITSYDIYRYYYGPFKINSMIINKFRGEKDASLVIGNKLSKDLSHKDFGDMKWKGDCFNFVEQIFDCGFYDALKIINKDFNLGLGDSEISEKKSIITWKMPEIEIKEPPLIQIVTRKLNREEWNYWNMYHQGEEDIKREHIYAPSQIWRNKTRLPLGNLLTFCYYYPDLDKWKVYRPYAPKRHKNTHPNMWKWDTNLPFDYIENLEAVRGAKIGILEKSKKDRMVLMKALEIDTIANTQAEDPSCMTINALNIFETCDKKIAVSDNDKKGKEFSWWLTNNYGFKHCNVPDKYKEQNCTDFAHLSILYDLNKVKEHFKRKNII